jgi:NAD-dependent deacetylase
VEQLDTIAGWLRDADAIVVLTGAGISTESGIPDFRGPQGVWTKNPDAEKTATIQYYVSDPEIRKRAWKNRLEGEYWSAEPNDGHRALAELERRANVHTLVTQNVDGLHHRAGARPTRSWRSTAPCATRSACRAGGAAPWRRPSSASARARRIPVASSVAGC